MGSSPGQKHNNQSNISSHNKRYTRKNTRTSHRIKPRRYKYRPSRFKNDTSGGAVGVVIRIVILILFILFLILPQCEPYRNEFIDYLMKGLYKYQEVPDKVDFTVRRVFSIESDDYLNYSLFIPIPQDLKIDGKDAQVLESYLQEPHYTELAEGGTQWVWREEMDHGGKSKITIVYHFNNVKISWDISIGKSGVIDDVQKLSPKLVQRFTSDAWPVADYELNGDADFDNDHIPNRNDDDDDNDTISDDRDVDDNNDGIPDKYRIEPSNPDIINLLREILIDAELISGSNQQLPDLGHLNVYKVVDAIYDKIDDTCVYPTPQQQYEDAQTYGGYPKWATGTWNDKRGDCDDQSILFISLCRAAGIPAMLEIGALYNPQNREWEGHGWANVYIPYDSEHRGEKGYDYVMPMVDIVNDIFLFRDPNRFSEWVDDGVPGKIDPETGEWEISNIEKRYLAWEYTKGDTTSNVNMAENYITIEFKAYPPEKKIYI